MIIISDFDGTLTVEDVTTLFWDAHLPYDWRREPSTLDVTTNAPAAL